MRYLLAFILSLTCNLGYGQMSLTAYKDTIRQNYGLKQSAPVNLKQSAAYAWIALADIVGQRPTFHEVDSMISALGGGGGGGAITTSELILTGSDESYNASFSAGEEGVFMLNFQGEGRLMRAEVDFYRWEGSVTGDGVIQTFTIAIPNASNYAAAFPALQWNEFTEIERPIICGNKLTGSGLEISVISAYGLTIEHSYGVSILLVAF